MNHPTFAKSIFPSLSIALSKPAKVTERKQLVYSHELLMAVAARVFYEPAINTIAKLSTDLGITPDQVRSAIGMIRHISAARAPHAKWKTFVPKVEYEVIVDNDLLAQNAKATAVKPAKFPRELTLWCIAQAHFNNVTVATLVRTLWDTPHRVSQPTMYAWIWRSPKWSGIPRKKYLSFYDYPIIQLEKKKARPPDEVLHALTQIRIMMKKHGISLQEITSEPESQI